MNWNTLLLCAVLAAALESCTGTNLDKMEYRTCTKDKDCAENECCTFETQPEMDGTTKITWRCKNLGEVDQICHSLGSVHCPCRAGLKCEPKAIWFFGAGLCKEKSR